MLRINLIKILIEIGFIDHLMKNDWGHLAGFFTKQSKVEKP